jgi:hypothetical protein
MQVMMQQQTEALISDIRRMCSNEVLEQDSPAKPAQNQIFGISSACLRSIGLAMGMLVAASLTGSLAPYLSAISPLVLFVFYTYALTIGAGKECSSAKFDFERYVFDVPLFFGAYALLGKWFFGYGLGFSIAQRWAATGMVGQLITLTQSAKSYEFTPYEWACYIAKQTVLYQLMFSGVMCNTELSLLRAL